MRNRDSGKVSHVVNTARSPSASGWPASNPRYGSSSETCSSRNKSIVCAGSRKPASASNSEMATISSGLCEASL
ncbi:Uncharacterised protein [Mycobacteroides abscessus subsp. abscessus]|nr:Uncharacterised protein [Mycobacteroides abscessus subsp. abscessus]